MASLDHQKVLIVDFGSQVTQLIARRLREANVYCEIHPYAKAEAALGAMNALWEYELPANELAIRAVSTACKVTSYCSEPVEWYEVPIR